MKWGPRLSLDEAAEWWGEQEKVKLAALTYPSSYTLTGVIDLSERGMQCRPWVTQPTQLLASQPEENVEENKMCDKKEWSS